MSDNLAGSARETVGKMQETVGQTTGDLKTQAQGVYNQAAGQAQEQVARISEVIRDQPLTAALIALGIGYILGRLTA